MYPAFWVACSLTMIAIVLSDDDRFFVSWTDFGWNLTLVPQYVGAAYVDGAYWSLAVELQFYIMVWCMLRAGLMRRVETVLWLWLALAILDAARPMYPVERWLIANWAPLFVIGAVTSTVVSHGWTASRAGLLATSLLTAVWHSRLEASKLVRVWEGSGPDVIVVAGVLMLCTVVFVSTGLGMLRVRESALATVSGRLTYPVYLIHQVAGYLLYTQLNAALHRPVVSLLLTVLSAVLVGAALNAVVEQPLGPRLRRLVAGSHPRADASGLHVLREGETKTASVDHSADAL